MGGMVIGRAPVLPGVAAEKDREEDQVDCKNDCHVNPWRESSVTLLCMTGRWQNMRDMTYIHRY
jgi:hypothetical protein